MLLPLVDRVSCCFGCSSASPLNPAAIAAKLRATATTPAIAGMTAAAAAARRQQLAAELGVRLLLLIVALLSERWPVFERRIQPEELWLYRNPRTQSYVSTVELTLLVFVGVPSLMGMYHLWLRDRREAAQCFWSYSLACSLCGAITNVAKVIVGRPRPDFFYRCFPDGNATADMHCTGDPADILEGRKSFPSGHSAWSSAALGFAAWYVSGKLHTFGSRGAASGWRLVCAVLPLLCAAAIALSRTCDYHHHWQDVATGVVLGLSTSYVCYRRYYPSLDHPHCDRPLVAVAQPTSAASAHAHCCCSRHYGYGARATAAAASAEGATADCSCDRCQEPVAVKVV